MRYASVLVNRSLVNPIQRVAVRCPFHDEKTPSCTIDLADRTFVCFGCGAHGKLLHKADANDGTLACVLECDDSELLPKR
jgi:hypothetical protein